MQVGNGQQLHIANTSQGFLPTPYRKLHLPHILHVPKLSHNFLSIHKLTNDNSCYVLLDSHGYAIKDSRTNMIILYGPNRHGLYPISSSSSFKSRSSAARALLASTQVSSLWHQRLEHPSATTHSRLASSFSSITSPILHHCTACAQAKCTRLPFLLSTTTSTKCLELIHSDVWGPSPFLSMKSYRYYVIFVDDFSRYSWIYPLHNKSEVCSVFL